MSRKVKEEETGEVTLDLDKVRSKIRFLLDNVQKTHPMDVYIIDGLTEVLDMLSPLLTEDKTKEE